MRSASDGAGRTGGPSRCCDVLPDLLAGANVGACERGKYGARITSIDLGGFAAARHLACALNDALGINAAADHAVLVGCLRDWNSEAAASDALSATIRRFMNVERQALAMGILH